MDIFIFGIALILGGSLATVPLLYFDFNINRDIAFVVAFINILYLVVLFKKIKIKNTKILIRVLELRSGIFFIFFLSSFIVAFIGNLISILPLSNFIFIVFSLVYGLIGTFLFVKSEFYT